ncbi:glutathione S-transferase family protein [Rheinheimera sp. MMS21-TC3]|uniref:glutathione S-transferase family protein n=1 Tax=Rheinheimera sp. MMS21-TC3 TaxID=3072790 RepID=UPI0028C3BB2D|nr:glutathione S-transferase family protein [Rheinheimera sp. MMS21-TC3]WNO61239.1 glutathione S-transferase family protein [Rheinheimera sp. MMS21-TC3]
MKLFGSQTSPYVRRIRLALADKPFQLIMLNIFDGPDRATLIKYNPARKVPMLLDGEQIVFDSGVIYRYIAEKFSWPKLSWQQENQLTIINAANDSMIELLLCKRSGFDIDPNKLFYSLQHERIEGAFKVLEQQVSAGQFNQWHYPAIALFCLLDWALYRELISLQAFTHLKQFHQQHLQQPGVAKSDPRLG